MAATPPPAVQDSGTGRPGMAFREFVAFVAAVMATSALAVDAMLPGLPVMGQALGVVVDNDRQWIVTVYLLGLGGAQIFYGTLADRFGRRPVLLAALAIYTAAAALSGLAGSMALMLPARALQGVGAAGARVLAISIIRDRYAGRQMARVTSLAFIIFLAVPIAAPTLGQWILGYAQWWAIFFVLGGFGALVLLWTLLRLPETLHEADRLPIDAARIAGAFLATVRDRQAVGYTLAFTLIVGSIFGYLNSAQQIFSDVFHAAAFFPTAFGLTALAMVASALVNARIVGRFGMHRVSHSALLGFVAIAAVHVAFAWTGGDTLPVFMICQSVMFFCLGLIGPNFGALSMEPLGHIAGTASSVQGFVTTVGGALVGFAIGQRFDGSARPLTAGFFVFALVALAIVLVTERGRLFRQTHGAAAPPAVA